MFSVLKNIYKKINENAVRDPYSERMPLNEQKIFLSKFSDPKDDYEQSYYKYLCYVEYCYYGRKWLLLIYNIGAMVILPFLYLILSHTKGKEEQNTTYDAVVENVPRLPIDDVVPEVITEHYKKKKYITDVSYKEVYLIESAKNIYKCLRKQYFSKFYFRLIVMVKLALYSKYIREYHPQAIIFYSKERDFAGPLQTYLCELEGIEHKSFMHGDYLYELSFAFQRYSCYYTWDKLYNDLFASLRCNCPMEVYIPGKLKGIAKNHGDKNCKYYATYYFSNETRECAERVYDVFEQFSRVGLRCKIRPHPRFSDLDMLKEVFKDVEIEDVRGYTLSQSITDSMYSVGLNTTVLSQAYFSGKKVIIDDISTPNQYQQLSAKGYIMIKREHLLLSEVLKSIQRGLIYDKSYEFVTCEGVE